LPFPGHGNERDFPRTTEDEGIGKYFSKGRFHQGGADIQKRRFFFKPNLLLLMPVVLLQLLVCFIGWDDLDHQYRDPHDRRSSIGPIFSTEKDSGVTGQNAGPFTGQAYLAHPYWLSTGPNGRLGCCMRSLRKKFSQMPVQAAVILVYTLASLSCRYPG